MPVPENSTKDPRTDEELALRLAAREPDALAPAAEDIVQEVFLALWRRADAYDPRRGPFRPWLLQIAHFRVLNELRLPLGTVKTRIRSGMRRLRAILAPLGVAVAVLAILAGAAVRIRYQQILAQRMDRALAFVTASDITTLHLAAGPGVPARAHRSYRGREGTALAVIELHEMQAVPAGITYRAWILLDGAWIPVGSALPDASGNALIVTENRAVARLPQAVEVTSEASRAGAAPAGPVVIQWEKKE